jgi:hypothetical protein
MEDIPIEVYPRTAWFRPITDAYLFAASCGFGITMCLGALAFVLMYRGFKRDLGTILHYISHTFSLINVVGCFINLLSPVGCGPLPMIAISYTIGEIACDTYLLLIVRALVGPSEKQNLIRYSWGAFYFVGEYVTRVVQYAFVTYRPLNALMCTTTVTPIVSVATTIVRTAFVLGMGISMTFTLFTAKSAIVSSVGFKSVVAAIVLIIAKIALFLPFGILYSSRFLSHGIVYCFFHEYATRSAIRSFDSLVSVETRSKKQQQIPGENELKHWIPYYFESPTKGGTIKCHRSLPIVLRIGNRIGIPTVGI